MKKKGLIISTVVMVVVLIASLTTATYAWFSSSATATVSSITMNVGASSKVQIGLGSGTNATGYINGEGLSWTGDAGAEKWTGGSPGLGTSINTGLAMQVGAGIGSKAADSFKTDGTTPKMDATYTKTNPLYKGEGDTFDVEELVVGDAAIINGKGATTTGQTDVVELPMGLRIVQDNVFGTYCKITVIPTSGQTFIGMAAALHFEITNITTGKTLSDADADIFSLIKVSDTQTGLHFADEVGTNTDGYVFYFMIDAKQATKYTKFGTGSDVPITQFSIKFFISGYDLDCNNDSTGTGATINFEFGTCDSADWTADAKWTELKLA